MDTSHSRREGRVVSRFVLWLLIFASHVSVFAGLSGVPGSSSCLLAQDPAPALQLAQAAISQPEASVNPQQPSEKIRQQDRSQEKRRFAEVGMILLSGIVILGVFLLAMALVLGRRYRRIARTGPPRTGAPDPFWYLKDPGHHSHRKDDDDDDGGHDVSSDSHDAGDP